MSLPTGVEQEWLGGSLLSIHALAQRVVWEWMRDPADPEMARTVWMTSFIWHVSLSSCECPIKRPWKATTPWEKSGKHPTAASNVFLRQAVELQLINWVHATRKTYKRMLAFTKFGAPAQSYQIRRLWRQRLVNNNKGVVSMAEINGNCCDFFFG